MGWVRGHSRCRLAGLWLSLFGASVGPLYPQGVPDADLVAICASRAPVETTDLCRDVVVAMELLQPELGMALAGGNPVLGTASPIGTKFRSIPRVHLGGRITFVWASIPNVLDDSDAPPTPPGVRDFTIPMPRLDVSIGVFDGLRLGGTMSGFASVELLGSIGPMILPAAEGFQNDATGLGFGARVGLLRESFSSPGISLSGEYRWTGRIRHGDIDQGDVSEFGLDVKAASFRAGLSKSFVAVGLALTIGWDHYSSDLDWAVADPNSGERIVVASREGSAELDSGRWSASLDVSYIVLFLNIVAELGWQEVKGLDSSSGETFESGNFFGALGLRVSL